MLRLDLPRLLGGDAAPPAPRPALELDRNEWYQVSIPFARDDPSPRGLFGAELGAGRYGAEWILYRFDSSTGGYAALGLDDRLEPGRGYWIIQTVKARATIEVPADAREVSPFRPEACAAPACHRVRGTADAWTLGGLASLRAAPLSDARVRSDGGGCRDGCTLAQADARGLHSPALYAWNPASGAYDALDGADALAPWAGYWAFSVGRDSDLLLPGGVR